MEVENIDPIFSLDDDSYVVAYWFFAANKKDMFGILERVDGDGFRLRYRFRYYKDDRVGMESEDQKSVYEASFKEGTSEAEALSKSQAALDVWWVAVSATGEVLDRYHRIVRGGFKKFMKHLSREPFMHVQKIELENN